MTKKYAHPDDVFPIPEFLAAWAQTEAGQQAMDRALAYRTMICPHAYLTLTHPRAHWHDDGNDYIPEGYADEEDTTNTATYDPLDDASLRELCPICQNPYGLIVCITCHQDSEGIEGC